MSSIVNKLDPLNQELMFLSKRTTFINFNSRQWWTTFFQNDNIQGMQLLIN